MNIFAGKWEMIIPVSHEATEILDIKKDLRYEHRVVDRHEESACYYGTYELVPSEENLSEIIFYPSEEQPLFDLKTHLYLQTHYLAKVESDQLFLLDKPGKSEEFEFKRIH